MSTVLITGSNRGIGLKLVQEYGREHKVIACCRHPELAQSLQNLAGQAQNNVIIEQLDVTNHQQIENLANKLTNTPIDILINNAGVYGGKGKGFGETNYESWRHTLEVNTLSVMKMAESFISHLTKSQEKKLITISSRMGSIADNSSGGSYLYRSSKAAVNCVNKSLAIDLAKEQIVAVVLHPGWVATDMGGPNALIHAQESASKMKEIISRLRPQDSGKFYSYDGSEIPW